ncbi:MAG: phosphotransferase [Chloroflexota bacterium]|nr:phosphotransferase [Chloroflexota bacterium]
MLTPELRAALQSHYQLDPSLPAHHLTGGEWKTLYRVGNAVVSISHPSATVAGVAYEHRFLNYLHPLLPQVPVPIPARDGRTFFEYQGRIVTLLPWMRGNHANREQARLPAAILLAHYHQAALNYPDRSPRPDVSAWWAWDWADQDWPQIRALLASQPGSPWPAAQRFWGMGGAWTQEICTRWSQIEAERANLQRWVAGLAASDRQLVVAPIHDDYHRKNLLVDDEGITALLDWDGCHPDWLLWDVATATWEFCLDKQAHTLVVPQAQAFLQAYTAANSLVSPATFDLIIPFMRARRMIEILSDLRVIVTDQPWPDGHTEYIVHNLIALDNLRSLLLF